MHLRKSPSFPWVPVIFMGFAFIADGPSLQAEIRPEKVRIADLQDRGKNNKDAFIREGLVTGGDSAVGEFTLELVRWGVPFTGKDRTERVVFVLKNVAHQGKSLTVQRPPFFQVSVSAEQRRIVMTFKGKPRLDFDVKKTSSALVTKQSAFKKVHFFPVLEEKSWTLAFDLKAGYAVKVSELSNPVRVILDVKTGSK